MIDNCGDGITLGAGFTATVNADLQVGSLEETITVSGAAPARVGARWVLTDGSGSLPLVDGATGVGTLLACSQGREGAVSAEWTPRGLVPLTVHLADRAIDIGPVADPSFVGALS